MLGLICQSDHKEVNKKIEVKIEVHVIEKILCLFPFLSFWFSLSFIESLKTKLKLGGCDE